jgi:hypothetical protein
MESREMTSDEAIANVYRGSNWRKLLISMLDETDRQRRKLAALLAEEAIKLRDRDLTDQRMFDVDSMIERMQMKDAFKRILDVKAGQQTM